MLPSVHHANTEQTASDSPDLTFYASLELSRATWLVTCLLPERERMSKYSTPGGDGGALLGLLERMRARAQQLTGRPVKIVVIQEAGLDGFWVHRLLEANGIERAPSTCRVWLSDAGDRQWALGFIANPYYRFRPRPGIFGSWKLYALRQ